MELVELCIPDASATGARARPRLGEALGKTAVEVPDQAGFVVNRLLFPYLFDAVRLMERTGMGAADSRLVHAAGGAVSDGPVAPPRSRRAGRRGVDRGEPARRYRRGPLSPAGLIEELIGKGKLGRKSQAGFYDYD